MSVLLTHSQVSYQGDDVAEDFPTTFRFLEDEHLDVELSADDGVTWTTLVQGTDYEVTGADDAEPGGTVTLIGSRTPLATGETLRITRDTTDVQPVTFGTFTKFAAETHERELDRRTMRSQEQNRRIEALEALGDLVGDIGDLGDGFEFEDTFTASDPVENSFPIPITIPGGLVAKYLVGHVYPTNGDDTPLTTPPAIDWSCDLSGDLEILSISGLLPGINYTYKFLVIVG